MQICKRYDLELAYKYAQLLLLLFLVVYFSQPTPLRVILALVTVVSFAVIFLTFRNQKYWGSLFKEMFERLFGFLNILQMKR